MSTATPSAYARLPTFSAVIDGLASGLGIKRNKEDALANLGLFGGRIDAYCGSPNRSGMHDQILDHLAGSDVAIRGLVQVRLLDAEAELTNARATPLITEASDTVGMQRFIEIYVAPWIAQMLFDASQQTGTVLASARLLLEEHAASPNDENTSFLVTWKAAVKRAIPKGVNAPSFLSTLDKLNMRSQRKNKCIEDDIFNLSIEIGGGSPPKQEHKAVVDEVRWLYLAGMATMRLCAMAAEIIPEQNILALVVKKMANQNKHGDLSEEEQHSRICMYWDYFDPDWTLAMEFERLDTVMSCMDEANFDNLRKDSLAKAPSGLLLFVIDHAEGLWHLRHGRNELAEQCLQKVVAIANDRQLGQIAAEAASILIALRIAGPGPIRHKALNPLMRVRIDNMPQEIEICIDTIPTPFSSRSQRLKQSFYDSHLVECVAYFQNITRKLGVSTVCNPMIRFDANLVNLIAKSSESGAKLKKLERDRKAIVGTSIKPYDVLRDHMVYRIALFPSNLPGMVAYEKLPEHDKLRLLRFVDPEKFKEDLKAHDLGTWRHPDDVP